MNPADTRIVCLFDCDNTLLDNDALKADLDRHLRTLLGDGGLQHFWEAYEAAREERGYVDYPLTIEKLRPTLGLAQTERVWDIVWNYPFADRLYPGSLAVIQHIKDLGCQVGIVSDGDKVYQPHKIEASGLAAAVDSHVKIFIHKQEHIDEVLHWLPGDHHVFVDDKAQILGDLARQLGARVTTLHVRQGHYRDEPGQPPPTYEVEQIADLLQLTLDQLMR